mgnify:CR=1 FL=1
MANPILSAGAIDGQRIGLFGGSFNPPHPGHLAVSASALKRLGLEPGDRVIVHAFGQKYTFAVQTNTVVEPSDQSVMKHEDKPVLTLVTCKDYDEKTNSYLKRDITASLTGVPAGMGAEPRAWGWSAITIASPTRTS